MVTVPVRGLFYFLTATLLDVFFLIQLSFAHGDNDDPFFQQQVIAPVLEVSKRGSVAGELASFSKDGSDLMKGGFSLALPFHFPEDRGRLIFPITPIYSITQGISEWGIGWNQSLSITRFRRQGHVQYKEDDNYVSPWGTLIKGDEGFYYPEGMQSAVRLRYQNSEDSWIAYMPNNDRLFFGGENARIVHPNKGTFSWYLICGESAIHESSRYFYQYAEGERPILSQVHYGGHKDKYQYQIDVSSRPVKNPYLDYRSGQKVAVAKRIEEVTLSVAHGEKFLPRFYYHLTYKEEDFGPSFRLSTIQKKYTSGAQDPPHQFDYYFPDETLKNGRWRAIASFLPIFEKYPNALSLGNYSTLSEEENGLTEIEMTNQYNFGRLTLKEGHYEVNELPLYQKDQVDRYCRRDTTDLVHRPRIHARLRGKKGPLEVIGFQQIDMTRNTVAHTVLHACDFEGKTHQVVSFEDQLKLGDFTKLVDLSQTGKPDIVKIGNGSSGSLKKGFLQEIRLKIYRNISQADKIAFEKVEDVVLEGHFDRGESYALFQDINGDGILDLVIVRKTGISVWFGKGNYQFESSSKFYPFYLPSDITVSQLNKARIYFQDLNGDGIPEAIVQRSESTSIYSQQKDSFFLQELSSVYDKSWSSIRGKPVVLDVLGTGNVQLVARDFEKNQLNVLEMSEPGSGLMRGIQDGKGNQVEFFYKRVEPSPWIQYRMPVIDKIRISVSGEGIEDEDFEFRQPIHHSHDKGLLGFSEIFRKTSLGESLSFFQYGDQQPGVLMKTEEKDYRISDLWRVFNQTFETVNEMGVQWKRLTSTEKSFRQGPFVASEVTQYKKYERGICPARIFRQNQYGSTYSNSTFFDSEELSLSLHCLLEQYQSVGTHNRSEFDFEEAIHIKRNFKGLPVEVARIGKSPDSKSQSSSKVLQAIEYSSDFKIQSLSLPGQGKTTLEYDPHTHLLQSIKTPDEVVLNALRDPIHDHITELSEDRGDGKVFRRNAKFDPFERLKKSWNQITSDSFMHSETELNYAYPTIQAPGWIEVIQKKGSLEGLSHQDLAYERTLNLFSGRGNELATLQDTGLNGVFSNIISRDLEQGKIVHFADKKGSYSEFFKNPNYKTFYADAIEIQREFQTSLGFQASKSESYQKGVIGKDEYSYFVKPSGVVQLRKENDSIFWETVSDVKGQPTLKQMPDGKTYQFERDALGRLIKVILPSGQEQKINYNEFGELSKISRPGLGSILFSHKKQGSLIEKKEYKNDAGELLQSAVWSYDEKGRKTQVLYLDHINGEQEIHQYYYDGHTPEGRLIPGQRGRLSAVVGPSYRRLWTYRDDGKILLEEFSVKGFGTLMTRYQYHLDGSVRAKTLERKEKSGESNLKLSFRYELDDAGRESKVYLNDSVLYQLEYDDLSRLSTIQGNKTFSDFKVNFIFDSETGKKQGYTQRLSDSFIFKAAWNKNSRGLIDEEIFSLGKKKVTQSYLYTDSTLLVRASGTDQVARYGYDQMGLLTQFRTDSRSIEIESEDPKKWIINEGNYALDSLGRVIHKNAFGQNLILIYGPQGRVSHGIQFPKLSVVYGYDDEGIRIFKKRGDVFEEVYSDDVVLTLDLLMVPVSVQGHVIGYLENKTFKPLSVDARNTIIAEDRKFLDIPESYGDRESWSQDSARAPLIDYALTGYDSDLMAYRMKYRDYDPAIKRFLTPDPLFLENPDKCVQTPMECNLYGYASGNPISFVDPTGLSTHLTDRGIGPLKNFVFNYSDSKINPTHTFVFTTKIENGKEQVANTYSWGNDGKSWTSPNQPEDVAAATKALDSGLSKMVGDSSLDKFVDQAYRELQPNDVHAWTINDTCKDGADRLLKSAQDLKLNEQMRVESILNGHEQNSSPRDNFNN